MKKNFGQESECKNIPFKRIFLFQKLALYFRGKRRYRLFALTGLVLIVLLCSSAFYIFKHTTTFYKAPIIISNNNTKFYSDMLSPKKMIAIEQTDYIIYVDFDNIDIFGNSAIVLLNSTKKSKEILFYAKNPSQLSIYGDWIFFVSNLGESINRFNITNGRIEKITQISGNYSYKIYNDKIYYNSFNYVYKYKGFYSADLNGKNKKVISQDYITDFYIGDDCIYLRPLSENKSIIDVINFNGEKIDKIIIEDSIGQLLCQNKFLYYLTTTNRESSIWELDRLSKKSQQICKLNYIQVENLTKTGQVFIYNYYNELHIVDTKNGKENIKKLNYFIEHIETVNDKIYVFARGTVNISSSTPYDSFGRVFKIDLLSDIIEQIN